MAACKRHGPKSTLPYLTMQEHRLTLRATQQSTDGGYARRFVSPTGTPYVGVSVTGSPTGSIAMPPVLTVANGLMMFMTISVRRGPVLARRLS
jgi:hypothetical protein